QHLRRHRPGRDPAIDDLVRQAFSGEPTALPDGVEADLPGVADTVVEVGEGLPVVEIRGVYDVSGTPEFIGEGETPRRQSLCMMEEQKLSHVGCSLTSRRRVRLQGGSSRS